MAEKVPGGLPTVVLSDGRSVELNLFAVRRGDILSIANAPPNERDALANRVYERITGLSEAELNDLLYPDWHALDRKVQKLLVDPLSDPN